MVTFELLHTKLAPPSLPYPIVSRPALLARLDAGIRHKLVLLSAPAGFGKTTLLNEWLAARRRLLPQGRDPAAWVSLDAGDNDPVWFWSYVLAACQSFGSGIGEQALASLSQWQPPSLESVIKRWINELAQWPGEGLLILEDYHEITSPEVHASVAFLLDYLPSSLRLIILTRDSSSLPLAQLRTRGEVIELGVSELRFTPAESMAFFEQNLPFALSEDASMHLGLRVDGWAAGLRLIALALQNHAEPLERQTFIDTFSGSHQVIRDYLFREVLNVQSAPVQEFLLKTSILKRLCAPLCEAILGQSVDDSIRKASPFALNDSSAILDYLERANLFLTPLDGAGQWFRYHALFSEALQRGARNRFGESAIRELNFKASLWFERHGHLAEAIETSFDAGQLERAAGLIENAIAPRLIQNEYRTLSEWIARLPEQTISRHPQLCFTVAIATVFNSQRRSLETLEGIEPYLKNAEQAWRAAGDRPKLGELQAFRSIVYWRAGKLPQAFAAASAALNLLPDGEKQWRAVSLITIALQDLYTGKMATAWQKLLEAQECSQAVGNRYSALASANLLGEVAFRKGDLRKARSLFSQSLQELEHIENTQYERSYAFLGRAAVALEWNDFTAAERDAKQAFEFGRQIHDSFSQWKFGLIQARLAVARGDPEEARKCLDTLLFEIPLGAGQLLVPEVQFTRIWLALADGHLTEAERRLTDWQSQDQASPVDPFLEIVTLARLYLAQGKPEQALRLLKDHSDVTASVERLRSKIEVLILTALTYSALADRPAARRNVLKALKLGQSGGFQRIFLDEGGPLRSLLLDCRASVREAGHEKLLSYLDTLMAAFPHASKETRRTFEENEDVTFANKEGPIRATLSQQEGHVLSLLADGFSYQEIAQELVLSINTVKTHVRGIYRKLNIRSRTEARKVARYLQLMERL